MRKLLAILCLLFLPLTACGTDQPQPDRSVDPSIRISEEEAYEIACDYWDYTEGDVAPETGFALLVVPRDGQALRHDPNTGAYCYEYTLKWRVVGEDGSTWLSVCDQVRINAQTGACAYPD